MSRSVELQPVVWTWHRDERLNQFVGVCEKMHGTTIEAKTVEELKPKIEGAVAQLLSEVAKEGHLVGFLRANDLAVVGELPDDLAGVHFRAPVTIRKGSAYAVAR